jgi:hypothetical protein
VKELSGRFARYQGRLYEAYPTTAPGKVLLLAHTDSAPGPGFESRRPGTWRRHVATTELTEHYEVEQRCTFRGLDCVAATEDDDGRLDIVYLAGDSRAAAAAGMTETERGVFRARVDPRDLDERHEVRRDLGSG